VRLGLNTAGVNPIFLDPLCTRVFMLLPGAKYLRLNDLSESASWLEFFSLYFIISLFGASMVILFWIMLRLDVEFPNTTDFCRLGFVRRPSREIRS
jgi:hypothetical protein